MSIGPAPILAKSAMANRPFNVLRCHPPILSFLLAIQAFYLPITSLRMFSKNAPPMQK